MGFNWLWNIIGVETAAQIFDKEEKEEGELTSSVLVVVAMDFICESEDV